MHKDCPYILESRRRHGNNKQYQQTLGIQSIKRNSKTCQKVLRWCSSADWRLPDPLGQPNLQRYNSRNAVPSTLHQQLLLFTTDMNVMVAASHWNLVGSRFACLSWSWERYAEARQWPPTKDIAHQWALWIGRFSGLARLPAARNFVLYASAEDPYLRVITTNSYTEPQLQSCSNSCRCTCQDDVSSSLQKSHPHQTWVDNLHENRNWKRLVDKVIWSWGMREHLGPHTQSSARIIAQGCLGPLNLTRFQAACLPKWTHLKHRLAMRDLAQRQRQKTIDCWRRNCEASSANTDSLHLSGQRRSQSRIWQLQPFRAWHRAAKMGLLASQENFPITINSSWTPAVLLERWVWLHAFVVLPPFWGLSLSIYLCIYLSTYLSICLSVWWSTRTWRLARPMTSRSFSPDGLYDCLLRSHYEGRAGPESYTPKLREQV